MWHAAAWHQLDSNPGPFELWVSCQLLYHLCYLAIFVSQKIANKKKPQSEAQKTKKVYHIFNSSLSFISSSFVASYSEGPEEPPSPQDSTPELGEREIKRIEADTYCSHNSSFVWCLPRDYNRAKHPFICECFNRSGVDYIWGYSYPILLHASSQLFQTKKLQKAGFSNFELVWIWPSSLF